MFEKITEQDKRTNLEKEIDSVIQVMSGYQPDSEGYTAIVDNLEKLHKMKEGERNHKVKPDTIWLVGCNLLGIALIIWHEKADIITTKALGFVLKGRV